MSTSSQTSEVYCQVFDSTKRIKDMKAWRRGGMVAWIDGGVLRFLLSFVFVIKKAKVASSRLSARIEMSYTL